MRLTETPRGEVAQTLTSTTSKQGLNWEAGAEQGGACCIA